MQGMHTVRKAQGTTNRCAHIDDNGIVRRPGRGKRIIPTDIEPGCAALVIPGQEEQKTELTPAIDIGVVD